ncbi:MAG: chemotaxis protein CheD [Chthoniobacterales bacterium]|nr:chemotaxis protein CheD [Chthoniobacterales bacterium]
MPNTTTSFPPLTPQFPGIVVGVADMKVSNDPDAILVTYALGSCLGVTMHDGTKKIGGLLHVMLPDSKQHANGASRPAMFVDTGVPLLLQSMLDAGAKRENIRCKVFGGAQLLSADEFFRIGAQNVDAFYKISKELGLKVDVWEVSGRVNRTIRLLNRTGEVCVRVPARPEFIR